MKTFSKNNRHLLAVTTVLAITSFAHGQRDRHLLMNEQGTIQVRPLVGTNALPNPAPPPPTVANDDGLPTWELSLDEAIQIALQNTDAVRVLSGVGAASSGQTIYSPGISNTQIDAARATFDPNVSVRNSFLRDESPVAVRDPVDPLRSILLGDRNDFYDLSVDVTKRFLSGADAAFRVGANRVRNKSGGGALNPNSTSAVDFSLTQPLLRGRGADANSVPVVLAFLDTERSYFRLKGDLQRSVQGVIQGYWNLVQARIELQVLKQQIRASDWANRQNEARFSAGIVDSGVVAQSQAQLANLRASLISSESLILDRVASLKGILGLPPGSDFTIVPTTPAIKKRVDFDWDELVALAEQQRPDLVELQLVLDADRQRLLLARNQAQPQLDAVGLYRWNGIEGQMPIGDRLASEPGQFTDWSLAINFSVPLTMRAARANLRQNELLLTNDQVNLRQRLLEVSHELAFTVRSLESLYQQYNAFQLAREAAEVNLRQQFARFKVGSTTFLDFLLAVNTWSSSVNSEARSITQLNSTLATLELQTGTILETHGVALFEERFCSLGPLGRCGKGRNFPAGMRPTTNVERYGSGFSPSENSFNLEPEVDELTRLSDLEEEP